MNMRTGSAIAADGLSRFSDLPGSAMDGSSSVDPMLVDAGWVGN
jgi:hypothetical protein